MLEPPRPPCPHHRHWDGRGLGPGYPGGLARGKGVCGQVEAFLNEQIRFTDIVEVNRSVVENIAPIQVREITDVLHIDKLARELAQQAVLNR